VAGDCQKGFNVAIVGVDRKAVHLVSPQEDKSPLPKDVELEARRLLSTSLGRLDGPTKVLDEPPRALRVKHDILLLFVKYEVLKLGRIKDRGSGLEEHQAPVLLMDNSVFPLPFTYGHLFFSVDGKLHLACTVAGPQAARIYRKLYDLSGETLRMVYDEHEKMYAHGTAESPAGMTPQDRTTRGDAASELGLKILRGKVLSSTPTSLEIQSTENGITKVVNITISLRTKFIPFRRPTVNETVEVECKDQNSTRFGYRVKIIEP
jgi:hypothetical protein